MFNMTQNIFVTKEIFSSDKITVLKGKGIIWFSAVENGERPSRNFIKAREKNFKNVYHLG